jgi:protein phosphatase
VPPPNWATPPPRRGDHSGVRLTIPDPALVLLVGPSGAGKSTFAAAHFSRTEIVSSDAARALLTDDAGDQTATAEAFHIVALIVNGRLRRRLTTVIDATNLRAANRKRYTRIAARYGVRSVAIAFDLPLAEYQRRNSGRPERLVEAFVVEDQAARMVDVLVDLRDEGYASLYVVTDPPGEVELVRQRI